MAKFFALLSVRDEADIIGQCLTHLLSWADRIFIFDTGSVDDTWEIVLNLAKKERRVEPLGKDPVYFSDTVVRGWIFNQARKEMETGDWFLRVDADEFHHIPPPEFVQRRLRPCETVVYHQYYNFCLLRSDVEAWNSGVETVQDRSRPIEERRRWYLPSLYSEPRLCRYRESMQWAPSASFPFNAGFVARERLPIRHYPHRDPLQLARRCKLRAAMMDNLENRVSWDRPDLHHWATRDWRRFITEDNSPGLMLWKAATEFNEVHYLNHLAAPVIRLAQRFAHAFLLPFLDQRRPRWPEMTYPRKISPEMVERLQLELREECHSNG